ncbi:MAG: hypothetical protein KDB07_00455 [Planctomycetes bacterium]|nr:hypothetical protein [Planctomycetota bacterium]
MDELDTSTFNADRFAKAIGLNAKLLSVSLPDAIADALKIASSARVSRDDWKSWLPRLSKVEIVLLWSTERRNDDQEFLSTLARVLPKGVIVWSFHHMLLQAIDRLTGDAVQTLLTTDGLVDGKCANTGIGFYVRSFKRAKGTTPEAIPEPPKPSSVKPPQSEVAKKPRTGARRAKASNKPAQQAPRARAKTLAKTTKPKQAKTAKKKTTAKKLAKKPVKKVAKKATKKVAKKSSKKITKKAAAKPAKKASKKSTQKPVKKAAKKTTKKAKRS